MNYRSVLSFLRSAMPLWCTFALFQFVDAVVYPLLHTPVKYFQPGIYLTSCLMNLVFIAWFWALYAVLPHRGRKIAAVVISLLLTLLIVTNALVYHYMGEYLSVSMLSFVHADSDYLASFTKDYLLNFNMLWFVAIFCLLLALWFPRAATPRTKRRTVVFMAGALLLPLLYLIPLNQVNLYGRQAILTSTASTGLAIRDYLRFVDSPERLSASPHMAVHSSERTNNRDFNIVLIVNESWGKHGLPFYGSRDTIMPFLSQWVAKSSNRFFVFERAYTNSGATNVSVPSLMTGVGPEEHAKKLHTMPFVWDWARAAGMSTLFVSAQRYTWAHFDRFFFSPGPDVRITADNMDMPAVNNTGVDELYASDQFCKALDNLPKEKRFFAVYNSNAMHMPFQQSSNFITEQPPFSQPYYKAAWLLDKSFRRIYETLQKNGELSRTLIIFTADHSEYLTSDCHDCTPRITAFNKTIMNIPFLAFIPESWPAARPAAVAALRANCSRPVANLDIAPTVVDVLGLATHEENRSTAMELKGSALTTPMPLGRMIVSLNTNDIRHWDQEGFSIYGDSFHFSFSGITGSEYFDLVSDPAELVNTWNSLPENRRKQVLQQINSIPHLKRIYSRFVAATAGR